LRDMELMESAQVLDCRSIKPEMGMGNHYNR